MGQRSDGYEHITLPDKQTTLAGQRMLVRDLNKLLKDKPGYAHAVQLQKAQRDLSEMTKLYIVQGEQAHEEYRHHHFPFCPRSLGA